MTDIAWPLEGHKSAEALFTSALNSGRLHHGWLIEGPSGIGKARLAKRIAARLLGAKTRPDSLDASKDDPIVQKVLAGSHPDLEWLQRENNDQGKLKQDISVDQIRHMNGFFSLKAALGGWRVGIVDSLDELNRSGGNALLKTLEEPPDNCLLVLISHGTKPLLPTIRSRCRTLRLAPLSETDTQTVISREADEGIDVSIAKEMARGRPGHGIMLATPSGLHAAHAARAFLKALPRASDAVLADFLAKASQDGDAFDAASDEVLAWLQAKSEKNPKAASVWLSISRILADATVLNMDRAQTLSKIVVGVQSLSKTG